MADPEIIATSAMGVVTMVGAANLGVQIGAASWEAADPLGLAPSVGDGVIVDYVPSSGQWVVAAILV